MQTLLNMQPMLDTKKNLCQRRGAGIDATGAKRGKPTSCATGVTYSPDWCQGRETCNSCRERETYNWCQARETYNWCQERETCNWCQERETYNWCQARENMNWCQAREIPSRFTIRNSAIDPSVFSMDITALLTRKK